MRKMRRRSGVVGALWGIFWGVLVFGAALVVLNEYGDDFELARADRDDAGSPTLTTDVDPADAGKAEVGTADATGAGESTETADTETGDVVAAAPTADDTGTATDNETSEETGSPASDTSDDTSTEVARRDKPQVEVTPESRRNPLIADLLGPQIPIAGPAVDMNAREFTGRDGAGLLSVVLYTTDDTPIPASALAEMSMPLTLVLDPGRPGDLALARSAEEMGREVLAVLPLAIANAFDPEGLSTEDDADTLEVGTAETLVKLNMAIGAVSPDGAEILDDPEAMAALLKPVAAHSFLWVEPRESARSAAAGLAANSNLLFLQSNVYVEPGSTGEQVLQALEIAAFQARRRGSAVIFVEASQEGLRAVVLWGLQNSGRDVIFAPISAIMRKRVKG